MPVTSPLTTIAGGLWRMRHEPVMTKALHVAHAALAGVWIALWHAKLLGIDVDGTVRVALDGAEQIKVIHFRPSIRWYHTSGRAEEQQWRSERIEVGFRFEEIIASGPE